MFFSILSDRALISGNLTIILSFNFSKEELNSDLKIGSSCFTPLSLVFGSAIMKIRNKINKQTVNPYRYLTNSSKKNSQIHLIYIYIYIYIKEGSCKPLKKPLKATLKSVTECKSMTYLICERQLMAFLRIYL